MRSGLIMQKIGMSSLFTPEGIRYPVTLLKNCDCVVVGHRVADKDGYNAVILGGNPVKEANLNKPLKGFFAKASVEPRRVIKEFRVSSAALLDIGSSLDVDHFNLGQFVDVVGNSIGKGFAGSMKRHNFAGLEATHGVSISHRSHGSTGNRQDPGRVFKNKKMAGHLGNERVTIQNLKIVKILKEEGLLLVLGAVPGKKGSYLYVKDAIKKANFIA